MWNKGIKFWISALSHVGLSWVGHLNFSIQNYLRDCKVKNAAGTWLYKVSSTSLNRNSDCANSLVFLSFFVKSCKMLESLWRHFSKGASGAALWRRMSRSQRRAQEPKVSTAQAVPFLPAGMGWAQGTARHTYGTEQGELSQAQMEKNPEKGRQSRLIRAFKAYICPWGLDNTQVQEFLKWDELNGSNLVQFAL